MLEEPGVALIGIPISSIEGGVCYRVAMFPTSLCPGEVLRVATWQEIASCHFY